MNANLIRYGIIAGAAIAAVGAGFGGYKGVKALRRRSERGFGGVGLPEPPRQSASSSVLRTAWLALRIFSISSGDL